MVDTGGVAYLGNDTSRSSSSLFPYDVITGTSSCGSPPLTFIVRSLDSFLATVSP